MQHGQVGRVFEGALSEQDKLVYINHVIVGKLLESKVLQEQAAHNSKEQFAGSPDLKGALVNAAIDALDAHTLMSTQVLNDASVQAALMDILLNHVGLWDRLRANNAPHAGA